MKAPVVFRARVAHHCLSVSLSKISQSQHIDIRVVREGQGEEACTFCTTAGWIISSHLTS